VYRWFQLRGFRYAMRTATSQCTPVDDIDERGQSEEKPVAVKDLLEAQRLSHAGSWRHDLSSG
jgi:hypothetical protein